MSRSFAILALVCASLVFSASAQTEESTAATPTGTFPKWAQCGGKSGVCGQAGFGPCADQAWGTCADSYVCTRESEWYYQCQPEGANIAVETSSTQTTTTLANYAQCGGLSGTCGKPNNGPCEDAMWTNFACPSGFTCQKQSQWYYQCLPAGTTPAPAATTETSMTA